MSYPTVYLIGLHGTGKSTIARRLNLNHGWSHLSVGDLSRVIRSGRIPREISMRLVTELASHCAGSKLGHRLVETLLAEVSAHSLFEPVICDGFPAHTDHLALLPAGSVLVHTYCPEDLRVARLEHRGNQTRRKWTVGMQSERDQMIPKLVEMAKQMNSDGVLRFCQIDNSINGLDALKAAVAQLMEQTTVAF